MMHHKGKFGLASGHDVQRPEPDRRAETADPAKSAKGQRDQMKRPPLEERRAMHDIIASVYLR